VDPQARPAHPPARSILLVSGRASFELVQKAALAGIPILPAVGAPSSPPCQTALRSSMTLAGFLCDNRFTIYPVSERK
jgi:FdhD protein